jgi:hypothetical protein
MQFTISTPAGAGNLRFTIADFFASGIAPHYSKDLDEYN